jgi:hypothetical protein
MPVVDFFDELKALYNSATIEPMPRDHYYTGGDWPGPCMCGHDSPDHRMAMSCDDPDCDCGDFEPRPGMANPLVRHEGPHPFLSRLPRGRSWL